MNTDKRNTAAAADGALNALREAESGSLGEVRRAASRKFEELPWPRTSEEEWRRSDVSGLHLEDYLKPDGSGTGPVGAFPELPVRKTAGDTKPKSGKKTAEGVWSGRIIFSGNTLVSAELDPALREQGVIFSSYAEELREHHGILAKAEAMFARSVEKIDNRIEALHYSTWDHGAVLYVPPFVEIRKPFLVDFLETGHRSHTAPHLLVYLDTGARAVVAERLRSGERDVILCTAGFDVMVEESAALELSLLQQLGRKATWFSHGNVTIGKSGTYNGFEAVLGATFSKSRTEAVLTGEGADAHLRGIYLADRDRHMDIRTVQRHRAPKAASRSFYKGAVKDSGRSVYQGLIEVAPNASGTDAFLTNRNLVLSDGARADSIPSLEIKTNDVKCSHGSTTGKIDPEQRFYLQARGLSKHEADRLLVTGYFEDVYRTVPETIQEELRTAIGKRIR